MKRLYRATSIHQSGSSACQCSRMGSSMLYLSYNFNYQYSWSPFRSCDLFTSSCAGMNVAAVISGSGLHVKTIHVLSMLPMLDISYHSISVFSSFRAILRASNLQLALLNRHRTCANTTSPEGHLQYRIF